MLTVIGVEYEFQNVPVAVPRGASLRFENAGTEVHELIVIRRMPGVTESFDELFRLPPGEAEQRMTILGTPIAEPGQWSGERVWLDQPGDHLLICLIPVGLTALARPGEPRHVEPNVEPHAALGMRLELRVDP